MSLATWWRGDPLPQLSPLADFAVMVIDNPAILHPVTNLSGREIEHRLTEGHQPYVGLMAGKPVAYGWLATRQADIGELKLTFRLPAQHRYLWDFATQPPWRGRGIYPHLLQAILAQDTHKAVYFWIIHAPENGPSRAGIRKAGFSPVGQLSLDRDGHVALSGVGEEERVYAAAGLLGVPLAHSVLSPCWHCGGANYAALPGAARCTCHNWPGYRWNQA